MTTGRLPFRTWRRAAEIAQAILVLGLPFLRVGGESALRFDVPTLRLHFFGASLAMDEMYPVLAATIFVTFAFLLLTLVLGRAWCGWACPQTALSDLTAGLDRWRRKGGARAALAWAGMALASAVVSANLVWYFVEPGAFLRGVAAGSLHPVAAGSWAVLGATIFLDLAFLRARFCATACPYARMQGVLFDRHTLVVAYDASRAGDCIDCGACVRCCPTGIDIREGLQMQCIACAECVDACQPIMRKLGRRPDLVGYFFGEPGRPRRLARPAVLAVGALTAASLALLAGTALARTALDLEAQAAPDFAPRRTAEGQAVNAYQVALENRGRQPVALRLELVVRGAPGVRVRLRPEELRLAPGEHRSLRVLAVADGVGAAPRTLRADLGAGPAQGRGPRSSRAVPLVIPAQPERAP
ncbi:MAG TPA: 4Fe-4S dicluster domain-containing protein [Anaeromyxobacteraceae bacterium]|nr:4Fe-4S dicluster domain-containing protein [Anaeromyxobacteraceae bacterium]